MTDREDRLLDALGRELRRREDVAEELAALRRATWRLVVVLPMELLGNVERERLQELAELLPPPAEGDDL